MVSRRTNPSERDFKDMLRDGLSSSKSYIVLKEKTRTPVVLQFKPYVQEVAVSTIYVGGKLSAFIDSEHAENLNSEELDTKLNASWKKLPRDRVGGRRIGSNAGLYMLVSSEENQIPVLMKRLDKSLFVTAILEGIEQSLGFEITNRSEVMAYLTGRYHDMIVKEVGGSNFAGLTPRQLGKISPFVFGYDAYNEGVVLKEFMTSNGVEFEFGED